MKNRLYCILFTLMLIGVGSTLPLLTYAQEKDTLTDDGTVTIRIEKKKDGNTEVIERTYKATSEALELFLGDHFIFPADSSLRLLGSRLRIELDSAFSHLPNQWPWRHTNDSISFGRGFPPFDSLVRQADQLIFQFRSDFDQAQVDSMIQKSLDKVPLRIKSLKMDSLFNHHGELFKNFRFEWPSDSAFNLHHLMLDKEFYEVQEVECDGKTMLLISPKSRSHSTREDAQRSRQGEQQSLPSLNLYPNPNNGKFIIQFELPTEGSATITVVNPAGKEVFRDRIKQASDTYLQEIDLSGKAGGVYIVSVVQHGRSASQKVIIK